MLSCLLLSSKSETFYIVVENLYATVANANRFLCFSVYEIIMLQ